MYTRFTRTVKKVVNILSIMASKAGHMLPFWIHGQVCFSYLLLHLHIVTDTVSVNVLLFVCLIICLSVFDTINMEHCAISKNVYWD